MSILLVIIILGILIFVHEFGHFFAARRAGVVVEEFAFGFPPRLVGWRRGSLLISLNAIPFGGFVRLQGEHDDPNHRQGSFVTARWPRQVFVLAAGVIMNYLLAWVIMSGIFAAGLSVQPEAVPADSQSYLHNQHVEAVVTPGSAADRAGLRTNDTITAIDGQHFTTTEQVIAHTSAQSPLPAITVDVLRGNIVQHITIHPATAAQDQPHYGFGIQSVATLQYPWYSAPWYGLVSTADLTGQTFKGFGLLISQLVTKGTVSNEVTGPIGIAVLTGQISQLGFTPLLQFVALLSISLAVVNFLPLPALDGGRALFVLIGRVRGRPVNPRVESIIHAAGFYALILLVIAITIRDVQRFDILSRLGQLFGLPS